MTYLKWQKGRIYNQEYSTQLSFGFDGETKSATDKQKLRVQHHQSSLTTNVKGTSLGEKEKATTIHKKITKWKAHW